MKGISFQKCCFSPRKNELTHWSKVMDNESSFLLMNLLEIKSQELTVYK